MHAGIESGMHIRRPPARAGSLTFQLSGWSYETSGSETGGDLPYYLVLKACHRGHTAIAARELARATRGSTMARLPPRSGSPIDADYISPDAAADCSGPL